GGERALGFEIFFRNLRGEQRGLAVGREPAGQRHAEADLDRLAGLGPGRACEQQRARRERRERAREASHPPACCIMQHRHPPIAIVSALHLMGNGSATLVGRHPFMRRQRGASAPASMMVSTSPAPLRRKAAARWYSGEVKQATPCSKVGNSITTKRWNLAGPSMI